MSDEREPAADLGLLCDCGHRWDDTRAAFDAGHARCPKCGNVDPFRLSPMRVGNRSASNE